MLFVLGANVTVFDKINYGYSELGCEHLVTKWCIIKILSYNVITCPFFMHHSC